MTDITVVEQDALPICTECGEGFDTHRGLASHMKKHAKPQVCPQCGETVRYLAPHLVKAHPERNQYEVIVQGVSELVLENLTLKSRVAELEQALERVTSETGYGRIP